MSHFLVWRIDDYNTPECSAEELLAKLEANFKGKLAKVHTKNMKCGVYAVDTLTADRLRAWMGENAPLVVEITMDLNPNKYNEKRGTRDTLH